MSRLDLTRTLVRLGEQPFLIGDIGFDCIGNEKVGTPAGGLCQLRQASLGFWSEPHTKCGASCVRHEYILAHRRDSQFNPMRGPGQLLYRSMRSVRASI